MDFYLGTDVAGLRWGVPVMVSHGRLRNRKTLPKASAPWICDSRGFTELSQHGKWTFGPLEYADALVRYADQVGQMRWASPQDWMCEPFIIAKTGLTVTEHQARTIDSVCHLRALLRPFPVKVIPVLQGYTLRQYERCLDKYADWGVDLFAEPVVGLGSVCRRQNTDEIHTIVSYLAALGLKLHGFGVKTAAVEAIGPLLTSADSQAWSYGARRRIVHCTHGLTKWAANCRNCALAWRADVLGRLGHVQLALPIGGAA